MKKSLLAVAVAAALPALAHAQSSVTLYGILDASVEYSDDQSNASLQPSTTVPGGQTAVLGDSGLKVNSGTQSGSRFGIRGVEDLGGGLQAVFTLEHGLNVDTGSNADANKFWNRQAFVGLNSRFGQLTIGRQYSPIFWALLPADFAGYTFYNNWAAFTGTNASIGTVQGPFRIDNSLAYKSPTFGGLTVYAMYAPGERLGVTAGALDSTTLGSGDIWGIAAGWQLGGLYLTAGYHSIDNNTVTATAATPANAKDVLAVAASYKFTNFGLSLGYTQINFEQLFTTVQEPSVTNILVSAFANIGPGTLIANVINTEVSDLRYSQTVSARNDSGLNFGIAYTMPLSKRTNWYLAYGFNDFSGYQSTNASTIIDSQNRFSIGMRHLF
jgi:predicted porin